MEQKRLSLYQIDMKYVRDLSKVDDNIMSVSPQIEKEKRPFIGIIIVCEQKQYCIPLSSPKPKHHKMKNDVDFTKIYDRDKLIGVLNFNNMVPVSDTVLKYVNIKKNNVDTPEKARFKKLAEKQLDWCQQNQDAIVKKANKLYQMITQTPEKNRNLTRRCCNFKKLEAVLEKKLEKEGIVEYKTDEQKFVDNIKSVGIKPTYTLIKNYKEINDFYRKEVSVDSISKLYKNPDLVPEDIKHAVKSFGDECKVQQQQRCQ